MGRPRKEIAKLEFEGLCKLQCTEVEMCGFFGVSEDTLNRWCKRTYGRTFAETYKVYSQDGKISLRRMQWNLAKKSPAMAIFLGKNMLGQTDDPNPMDSEEATRTANEQTLAIAALINNPQPDRTPADMEEDASEEGEA